MNQLKNLLHGDEEFISGDAGYQGVEKREELKDTNVEWLIAERPGKVRALKKHPRKNKTAINIEYLKASIRAKVEHPFRIIKCQFGFIKARYKGLTKNDSQLAMLFTSRCYDDSQDLSEIREQPGIRSKFGVKRQYVGQN